MNKTRKLAIAAAAALSFVAIVGASPLGRLYTLQARDLLASRTGVTIKLDSARARLGRRLGSLPDPTLTRIVVRKSARTADVVVDDRVVTSYRIALGGQPIGAKQREGDGRTPEGTYRICTRLDRSRFHLFMGLSYHRPEEAARGLSDGVISQAEHDSISAADPLAGPPTWKTALGGEVGLHGGGSSRDWTLGCIAFDNGDVEELWLMTQAGTVVEIRP